MNDLVSIVVPMYNGEKYIIEFLDSIFRQSYRPIQLLLGDDASTDNTVGLCDKWKKENENDKFIVELYVNKKNKGLTPNISNLLKYVKGNIIFLADQDDVWVEDKVEIQCNYFEEHPGCAVCLCDRSITDEGLNVHIHSNYSYLGYKKNSMDFYEVIKHRGIYAANVMSVRNYGKMVFDIPSEIVSHDTFLAMMAATQGSVDFLFEPLLYYRIHNNNLSGNYLAEVSKSIFQCIKRRYRACLRGKKSNRVDGEIIKAELLKRFAIDIDRFENVFKNNKKISYPLIYSLKRTFQDKLEGKIGKWVI